MIYFEAMPNRFGAAPVFMYILVVIGAGPVQRIAHFALGGSSAVVDSRFRRRETPDWAREAPGTDPVQQTMGCTNIRPIHEQIVTWVKAETNRTRKDKF